MRHCRIRNSYILINVNQKKYLVAVSGGVDSVVLLHQLVHAAEHTVLVAHVDHGIRGEASAADARFVRALAESYNLPYYQTELKLAPTASEDQARQQRYNFLLTCAAQLNARLVTAHHRDDMIGSMAINVHRGTG